LFGWDLDKAGKSGRQQAIKKVTSMYQVLDLEWGYKNNEGSIKDMGEMTKYELKEIIDETTKITLTFA
jgi:hypothetical protein